MELNSISQDPISVHWNFYPRDNAFMHEWARRLRTVVKERGLTAQALADASGVSKQNIDKYLQGRVEKPRGDNIPRLADALGIEPLWLQEGIGPRSSGYPVVGFVSAGEAFTPVDDHEQGNGLDYVTLNIDAADPVAVRVRGPSMLPAYRDGDVLFCSRQRGLDIRNCLHLDCIVMTADGEGYLKVLKPGRGESLYTLESYNRAYPPIENVEIEWVAPVRIVRRSLN